MLRELRIQNLILVEEVELMFQEGFLVLTGETGAGKSILLEALGLALGRRGSPTWIRKGCDQAWVEARFEVDPALLEAQEISPEVQEWIRDAAGEVLIRRGLHRNGRSQVRINGRMATLGMLEALGGALVEIHAQQTHQALRSPSHQRMLLDRFGELEPLWEALQTLRRKIRALDRKIQACRQEETEREHRIQTLRFQLEEVRALGEEPPDEAALEAERNRLAHGEALLQGGASLRETLSGEGGILEQLDQAHRTLASLMSLDPRLGEMGDLLCQAQPALEEAATWIRDYLSQWEVDPARLEALEEHLYRIRQLKRKYGRTLPEILALRREWEAELDRLQALPQDRARLEQERDALEQEWQTRARALMQRRQEAARRLEQVVTEELGSLGFSHPRFAVQVGEDLEGVSFWVGLNPGEGLQPLGKTASGGELSRIVLALKVALAGTDRIPTLVFDEVDAGIGGQVAHEVGTRLHRLGKHHQVLCVTHLPQIAARADQHFRVEKETQGGRTRIRVTPLSPEARVEEIARMLGGSRITETSRRHARELLAR